MTSSARGKRYTAGAALLLAAVNLWVIARLFRTEYLSEMGSIEAAYIGLARYWTAHFFSAGWFPLWYGGIPLPDSYPPLLHVLTALVSRITSLSPAMAYHAVTAALYVLGPVALFWAAKRLGAARGPAFGAALGYSLLSPVSFLLPVLRHDNGGWFGLRRMVILVRYGEGPHLTSLVLLPLAIGLLHVALERRRPLWYVLAALSVAGVVLSNWIGGLALAIFALAYLLAGYEGPVASRWARAAAVSVFAYLLASPWVAPSVVAVIRANAPLVGGRFESGMMHRLMILALVLAVAFAAWLLREMRVRPGARFALLASLMLAAIALPAYLWKFSFLPQSERYHLELDLALWMAVALCWPRAWRLARPMVGWALVALLALPLVVHHRHLVHESVRRIDIRETAEYRVSRWLDTRRPGVRVFAPGTIGFWMSAFGDTPLITGGFDNGMRNDLLQDIIFQVYAGEKPEVALDWLRAYGCDAVVGGDATSREVYHPYSHPEKFHSWPVLWREGGEVIYSVPRLRPSLAHVIRRGSAVTARPPGYSSEPARKYLDDLEDATLPAASFGWVADGRAVVETNMNSGQLLSVQVTYDEGWRARANGAARPVRPDGLGEMIVDTGCSGACRVDLEYVGAPDLRVARVVSPLALASGLVWIVLGAVPWGWRRRPASGN
jgi:hypothetical protein